jgi:hypothetical protein
MTVGPALWPEVPPGLDPSRTTRSRRRGLPTVGGRSVRLSVLLVHRPDAVPDPTSHNTAVPRRSQAFAMIPSAFPASLTAHADTRSPARRMDVLADSAPQPQGGAVCTACPHPVARHDAIGLRFCHATLKGSTTRGCVCRSS